MKIKDKSRKEKAKVIRFKNVYVPVSEDGKPISPRPEFNKKLLAECINNSNAPLSVIRDAVRANRNKTNKNNVVQFKPRQEKPVEDPWYYAMHCKYSAGKIKPVGGEVAALKEYYQKLRQTHKHKPKAKRVKVVSPAKERAHIHKDEVEVVYTTNRTGLKVSNGYSFNEVRSRKAANDPVYSEGIRAKDLNEMYALVDWLCVNVPIDEVYDEWSPLITFNQFGVPSPNKNVITNMLHLKDKLLDYVLGLASDYHYERQEEINELVKEIDDHVTNELVLYNKIEELEEQIGYQNQEIKLLEWEVAVRGEPTKAAVDLANQFIEIMREKDAKIAELQAQLNRVVYTTQEKEDEEPPFSIAKAQMNKMQARIHNQRKELSQLHKENKRLKAEQWKDRAEVIRLTGEKTALQKALVGMSERIKQLQTQGNSPNKASPPLNSKGLDAVEDFVAYAYTHTPIEVYGKYIVGDMSWASGLTAFKNALKRERLYYKRLSKKKRAYVHNKYVRGYSDDAVSLAERWAKACSVNYRDVNLLKSAQVLTEWNTYERWAKRNKGKRSINYQRLINQIVGVRGDVSLSNPRLVEGSNWEMKPFSKKAAAFYLPHTPEGRAARKIKEVYNKVIDVLNTEVNPIARRKQKKEAERLAKERAEAKRKARILRKQAEEARRKEEEKRLYHQRIREIQRLI